MERAKDHKVYLPALVRQLAYAHEAWLVGSAARRLIDGDDPRTDWDMIVPFEHWAKAALLIPVGTPSNTFGGFKVRLPDGGEVDVWPGSVGEFLRADAILHQGDVAALQLKTGYLLLAAPVEKRTWH